jgi:hypothetical protein
MEGNRARNHSDQYRQDNSLLLKNCRHRRLSLSLSKSEESTCSNNVFVSDDDAFRRTGGSRGIHDTSHVLGFGWSRVMRSRLP